jgi:hypothetical protein
MTGLPAWAYIAVGILLAVLSSVGLLFSVHTSAKVVYSFLLIVGIASAATGYRKRRAT